MTTRRKVIYAVLALVISWCAHTLWKTAFNPLVWNLTYIGVHVARAIHQPDYDSAASARVFDALAILINALVYFGALVALGRFASWLRSRRGSRAP